MNPTQLVLFVASKFVILITRRITTIKFFMQMQRSKLNFSVTVSLESGREDFVKLNLQVWREIRLNMRCKF